MAVATEARGDQRQHNEVSRGDNNNTKRTKAVARRVEATKTRRIEGTTKRRTTAAKTRVEEATLGGKMKRQNSKLKSVNVSMLC